MLLLGTTSRAQEPSRRSGADRQVVVQLAYTLGEAHALHRLCAGSADATWYARMQRLEAQEAAADPARAQLVEGSRRARATERGVAQRGAALAQRLAGRSDAQP